MISLINYTVRFSFYLGLNYIFIKTISYLAKALSLGLRLTANMIDFLISFIIFYTLILCLVSLSFLLLSLFIISLDLIKIDNFFVFLSLFPAFIIRKANN